MVVDFVVIETEIARYIDTIGTRHAVGARGAGNGGDACHLVGNLLKEFVLALGADLKG